MIHLKTIDTKSYLDALSALTENGHTVSTAISGGSMLPFLAGGRDFVILKKPDSILKKGDIVLFKRLNGNYILHRIRHIKKDSYYLIGDSQTIIEGPIDKEQIIAVAVSAKRKGKMISPRNLIWKFYSVIWLRLIPFRHLIFKIRTLLNK